jgi:hypothetical protein
MRRGAARGLCTLSLRISVSPIYHPFSAPTQPSYPCRCVQHDLESLVTVGPKHLAVLESTVYHPPTSLKTFTLDLRQFFAGLICAYPRSWQ